MKKLGKWLLIVLIALVVLIGATISYITLALPNVGKPENITINYTPQRVAHGKYLANHNGMYGLPFKPRLDKIYWSARHQ